MEINKKVLMTINVINVIYCCKKKMPLSPVEVAQAVALVGDGRSIRYAARVLGTNPSTVCRAVQRFRQTGTFNRRHGSGRRRTTQARDDRFIMLTVLRNRHTTAVETRNLLEQVRGVNVSERTIRRRFEESGLTSRRPATGPQLLRQHRIARLQFARDHVQWTIAEWQNVLFSDESRFGLYSPDGRERVWRRAGERYAQCNFSERVQYQGGSVMVWGGICFEARTELYFINGNLNAVRYIDEILLDHVVPFGPFIGENFLFMHDNARCHTAHIVSQCLDDWNIRRMDWAARSPDLNPIEHIWDYLGRRVRARGAAIQTLDDLRIALEEEWNQIPQIEIQNLIRSMPQRMRDTIQARGGNTRY